MPRPKSKTPALDRKRRVAAYVTMNSTATLQQIADALGITKSTVYRDVQELHQQWREQAAADVAVERGLAVHRLNALLMSVWPQAKGGDIRAVKEARELINAIGRIYGVDAPTKLAGPDGVGPVAVTHEHRHFDLSRFDSGEIAALYDLAAKYDSADTR